MVVPALGRLGCYNWIPASSEESGKGCCSTSCNTDHFSPQRAILFKMSVWPFEEPWWKINYLSSPFNLDTLKTLPLILILPLLGDQDWCSYQHSLIHTLRMRKTKTM